MIDRLTASDISNTVSMLRSSHKGPIIIVEGITDSRLYGKFVDKDEVEIVIGYSKDNVRRSTTELWGKRRDRSIIGIIDADLDRLNGKKYDPPLFLTDKRDLEAMIISSPALDDLLTEFADEQLLENFENRCGRIRDVLARASYPIGLLMYISSRDRIGLNFKDMEYRMFINTKDLTIDIRKMIENVFSGSLNKGVGKKELADKIAEEEETLDDPWIAVRGHDVVSILSMGLNESFGSYNSKNMKSGQLSGALRLSFGMNYFEDTDIYKDILKWSEKNNFSIWIIQ
jgi:hypothetical protein